jgi:hypothetical protein
MFLLHRLTTIRCVAFPGTTTSYHKQRVVAYVNFMPQHLAMLAPGSSDGDRHPGDQRGHPDNRSAASGPRPHIYTHRAS